MEPVETDNRKDQYRTLLVIGALIVVGWVLWSVRGALLPFGIGLVIAYLISPLVRRVELVIPRYGVLGPIRRTLAILIVYLAGAGALLIGIFTIGPALVDETVELIDSLPTYWEDLREEGNYWSDRYEQDVPPEVKEQIETNLDAVTERLSGLIGDIVSATFGTVRGIIGLLAGLVLLPLWVFYILKDERKALDFFYGLWPVEVRDDVRNILRIIDRVLASYIRGQLFLGLVVGVVSGVGFYIIDVPQPVALGVVAGVLELVPILGPWLTFIVAALVVLATDPEKFIWVAGLCLAVQQLENTFLVPRIQGNAVNMNPAVIMVLLVVGASLWGFLGIIIIVPIAAIARDVFVYIYNRLTEPAEEIGPEDYPMDDPDQEEPTTA